MITIHILDWVIWIIVSILFLRYISYMEQEGNGLGGCALTIIYLTLTIIYCIITYHVDINIPIFKFT